MIERMEKYFVVPQEQCKYIDTTKVDYSLSTFGCFICVGIGIIVDKKQFMSHTSSDAMFKEFVQKDLIEFAKTIDKNAEMIVFLVGAIMGLSDNTVEIALRILLNNHNGPMKIIDLTRGGFSSGAACIILDNNWQRTIIYDMDPPCKYTPNEIIEFESSLIKTTKDFAHRIYDINTVGSKSNSEIINNTVSKIMANV